MALVAILAVCWMVVPSSQALAATDDAAQAVEDADGGAEDQDAAGDETPSGNDDEDAGEIDVEEADDAFSDDDLEDLVARIALYPDPLLAQILIASTEPIDVVRAARWANDNASLDADGRAAALEDEDWDPSVKTSHRVSDRHQDDERRSGMD